MLLVHKHSSNSLLQKLFLFREPINVQKRSTMAVLSVLTLITEMHHENRYHILKKKNNKIKMTLAELQETVLLNSP